MCTIRKNSIGERQRPSVKAFLEHSLSERKPFTVAYEEVRSFAYALRQSLSPTAWKSDDAHLSCRPEGHDQDEEEPEEEKMKASPEVQRKVGISTPRRSLVLT